ncbi:MAG: efflux RND transporter permease subunit [Rhodothermales bacterium]|nr:efflux RND transporter permease subunit [Rhodothermales bacterium]
MTLSDLSMRRPVTTMMAFVCLVAIGGISSRLIPLELFPEFDAPMLWINLPYQGSTPDEIEREITRPAEEVIATVADIKRMRSDSRENGANVHLEFDWGVDTDIKAIEVQEKLDGIRHLLPPDFQRFFVGQFSSTDMPILQMRISSQRDLSGAYDLLKRKLVLPVERVDGVSKVELYGVWPREVRIELESDRVSAHQVSLVELMSTLQGANFSVTAGKITDGSRRYLVRPVGEISDLNQLESLPISRTGLRLGDIAKVVHDDPELREGRHLDGNFAIGLSVFKENGANTVEVVRRITAEFDDLQEDPEMQGINLYFMNNAAEGITSSLEDLLNAGILGGLFAFVILFFFLRRMSTTMIVAMAVPISIVVTIGFLYFLGFSLNILTMMGLMLAVGMLVDNAVVVTESIHRHQHIDTEGDSRLSALRGVKEVALAVTAGTLTTAIVFLPMIVSQADEVTIYLKHVSVAICVALVVSLLISLTVVPLLTARLKPPKHAGSNIIDRAIDRYARMLSWMIGHRWGSTGIILLVLVTAAIPIKFVKSDFFPDQEDADEIRLIYHINDTYTLERVEQAVDKIEAYLFENRDEFEIESVYSYYTPNRAVSTLILNDPDEAKKDASEIKELIKENLPKISIGSPSYSWRSTGGAESVRVTLSGESSELLADLSEDIETVLSRIDGLVDVRSEASLGEREVHVVVDRDRAQQYGYSSEDVAITISSAMRGRNLRRFRTPDGEIEMRIKYQDVDRQAVDNLRNLTLGGDQGQQVSLASLADFSMSRGPRGIHRENRKTMIGVTAGLNGITSNEATPRIREALERYEMPAGYTWDLGRSFRDEEDSQAIMLMNLLLALALIYLVMAALFESLIHPAAIWSSIVFSIIGVYWFFLITNTTFSIMAWIGILVLVGVVVNNGIVLIDHINFLRSEGMPRSEAIVQAGRDRMRPIIMTAATTVLGLIPLCIGTKQIGGDGPPYFPMARAIVGGLTFSTVVTLIILPSIYVMLDDVRAWSRRVVAYARADR